MVDAFLDKIVNWADGRGDIIALIMTGSWARPNGVVDSFSDYDLEIFTTEPERYTSNSDWMVEIGDVWIYLPTTRSDTGYPTRLVIYEGGRKIDFSILPLHALEELVRARPLPDLYERGYRVLIDKKGLAARLPPPSFAPPTQQAPSEEEFRATVEEFWFEAWHIPKYLHRDDLWVVKHRDWTMKEMLLRMVEWNAIAAGQSNIAHIGVRMKDWTRPDVYKRLHETFGRFDAADSRHALLATISLFRDVAKETSSMLGYSYPQRADDAISNYVEGLLDPRD